MIYVIAILLILIGVYYYDYKKATQFKLFYWLLVCALLICICGFRYRLGGDTPTYMQDFKTLHPLSKLRMEDFSHSRYAPGFILFFSLCKEIYPDFAFFQIVHSLIFNSVIFYFISRYSRNKYFAVLIYFFFLYFIMSFQQLREALAVCVFLLAWPAFRDRKWIWWYLASLLAFTFHLSASIMFVLPLICLPGLREIFVFGRRTIFVCLFVAGVGYIIQKTFFQYIELLSLTQSISERAQSYSENDLGSSTKNIIGSLVFFFNYAFYPLVILILSKHPKIRNFEDEDRKDKGFTPFVLISIYFTIITLFIAILGRYFNYFYPFTIVFLSNFLFRPFYILRKRFKLGFISWMIFFLPMFSIQVYNNFLNTLNRAGTFRTYMQYYPYNSIFDKGKDEQREKTIRYLRRRF